MLNAKEGFGSDGCLVMKFPLPRGIVGRDLCGGGTEISGVVMDVGCCECVSSYGICVWPLMIVASRGAVERCSRMFRRIIEDISR